MTTKKIMIFDSGAGGLSVASEILNALPWLNIDYVADLEGFPYGILPNYQLEQRVTTIVRHLVTQDKNITLVVIACNTASTVILDCLRSTFPQIEFVGVVPAIKPAVSLSKSGVIGLLATAATVKRPYTDQLIKKYANNTTVLPFGSETLVIQAENFARKQNIDQELISREIRLFLDHPKASHMDTLILACTHFPLIDKQIKHALMGQDIRLVDSGEAIARRVASLISTDLGASPEKEAAKVSILLTPCDNIDEAGINYARCLKDRTTCELDITARPLLIQHQ